MDPNFVFHLVPDDPEIVVGPCVEDGSRPQAVIPVLRGGQCEEEERATLVWKPWGDVNTEESQERVAELLKAACSSAVPGGATNVELALHCLHQAQGNVQDALDLLTSGWPRKSECHPLTDYHYAGSDVWTPAEEQLFLKAFRGHKKNFHQIQKKVQTKSVAQCVEYYYTWKKCRARKIKRGPPQSTPPCPPRKRSSPSCSAEPSCDAGSAVRRSSRLACNGGRDRSSFGARNCPCCVPSEGPAPFQCPHCERVFYYINECTAHMKLHRPSGEPPQKKSRGMFGGGDA